MTLSKSDTEIVKAFKILAKNPDRASLIALDAFIQTIHKNKDQDVREAFATIVEEALREGRMLFVANGIHDELIRLEKEVPDGL